MITALKEYYCTAIIPYLNELKDYFGEIYKMLIG